MDTIECVAAAKAREEKHQEDKKKENNNNAFSLELATTTATDPWMLFLYALKAPATKDKYIERLTKFLDFLGYVGTKEEKARTFAARARADHNYAFNSVLKFFQAKREQIDRKEMATGTVRNYLKSIKLFCDMADLQIPWAKIARGLPRAKRFADDRAPTLEEIRKIVEYPDRRIKPVVYMMASTGIRVGAWDYLKYGHITPIERDAKLVAAKVLVYAETPDSYVTFMTPEAYREVEAWMKFRKQCGEKISNDSWVMRDLWDTEAAIRKNMHTDGVVTMPKKLSSVGIKRLIERALYLAQETALQIVDVITNSKMLIDEAFKNPIQNQI